MVEDIWLHRQRQIGIQSITGAILMRNQDMVIIRLPGLNIVRTETLIMIATGSNLKKLFVIVRPSLN